MEFLAEHWLVFINMGLLLFGSAFFSGSETAFFSLTRHQKHDLEEEKSANSQLILSLLKNPSRLLVSILMGNLVVNVLFFSISAMLTTKLQSQFAQVVFGLIILFVVIIFGEILPKAVGVNCPVSLAKISAGPLWLWGRISAPFRRILEFITNFLEPKHHASDLINEDELKMLLNLSQQNNRFAHDTGEMIEDVIELSSTKIKSIMIPRVELMQCPNTMSVGEYVNHALEHELSYVPVYEGVEVDQIIGVVNTREICLNPGKYTVLRDFVESVRFVPETKKAGDLLDEMVSANEKLVMVVDEYGGVEGMVTLKDLLEEVLGNLDVDREDEEELEIKTVNSRTFIVPGHLPIHQWHDFFKNPLHSLEDHSFDASTLSGYIIARFGRFPEVDEELSLSNISLKVLGIDNRRITEVELKVN